MSIYLYSDRQYDIINSKLTLANIIFNDRHIALQTVAQRAVQQALVGESTMIVVSDVKEKDLLKDHLDRLGFEDRYLDVNIFDAVKDEDFHQLKDLTTGDSEVIDDINIDAFIFNKLDNDIKKSILLKYSENMLEGSWRDLLDKYILINNDDDIKLLHTVLGNESFSFEKKEYDEIKHNISIAINLFQKEFNWLDTSEVFADLQTNNYLLDNLDEVSHQLFTFKELANNISFEFVKIYHILENEFTNFITASYKSLKERLELLQYKSELFIQKVEKTSGKNTILNIFNKVKKEEELERLHLIQILKDIQIECHQLKIIKSELPIFTEIDLINVIQILISKIDASILNIPLQKSDYLKSINKLNSSGHKLEDLEYDLLQLVQQINKSDLLTKKYELNTLSFIKQMAFSIQLVSELDTVMSRIQNKLPYYRWMIFVSDLDQKSASVIHALKIFETDHWLEIFEGWYYYEVLKMTMSSTIPELPNNYLKARNYYIQSIKNDILAYNSKSHLQSNEALKQLKSNNAELYNAIKKGKKTKHPLTWKLMIEENTNFLANVFPILIVNSDEFLKIKMPSYLHLCYYNFPNINVNLIQLFSSIFSWFQDSFPISNPDFKLLDGNHYFEQTISEVSTSDRLPMVRNISNVLLSFDKVPEIFQLKDTTIISFSTTLFHKKLTNMLYDLGIKKIFVDDSALKNLIGAMLDLDKNVLIVIEDGLFNPRQVSSYIWQQNIIKSLNHAGCEIYNIDTSVLLETGGNSMANMINKIGNKNIISTFDNKSQLAFEF